MELRSRRLPEAGANGTMLHYETNRDICEDGTLLLMDLGAKYQGLLCGHHENLSGKQAFYAAAEGGCEVVLKANRTTQKRQSRHDASGVE